VSDSLKEDAWNFFTRFIIVKIVVFYFLLIWSFLSWIFRLFKPLIPFLKNRYFRYSVSSVLFGLVIYFYILYETYREDKLSPVLWGYMLTDLLVPLGLIFALIVVLYVSWDDKFFRKYRTPGLYMVILTTVFYALIFSGLSQYLFQLDIAKWLTKLTGTIVSSILMAFGMQIESVVWNPSTFMTQINFIQPPAKEDAILINAECSGIHSLTIFIVIFLIMLFEARRRLFWGYERGIITASGHLKTYFADIPQFIEENGKKVFFRDFSIRLSKVFWVFTRVGLITIIGILGTYLVNILRITTITAITYAYGWKDVGEPIHNYLGYVMLILWLPIFWLFILPLGERKELRMKRRSKKKEKRAIRKEKRQEKIKARKADKLESNTSAKERTN
jgi:exosortase/archaeosortase family protein